MLDVPADVPAIWAGLALAGTVLLAAAGALPTTAPPDAAAAANAVDTVAGGDATRAHRRVGARAARISPRQISLRNGAGSASATFAFGPVTPVSGGPLEAVLAGTPPAAVFSTKEAFRQAVVTARSREPTWEPADRLVVRRVEWNEFEATLVGT